MLKRIKRRYLELKVDSDGVPSRREFIDAVWGAITKLYGEHGASLTGLVVIDYNAKRKTAVVRISLAALNLVRSSLATIISIAVSKAAVHVLAVSGTIKALHERTR